MKTGIVITFAVIIVVIIGIAAATGGQKTITPTPTAPTSTATPNATTVPTAAANPTAPADAVSAHQVELMTSMGNITLNLYPADAPLAVTNFVTLGKRGYYNGTIFHRVIQGFMDQGGDPTGTGTGGSSIYGQYFKTEITSHQFVAGELGVARTSAMDTNGSQFFIMATNTPSLNGQYTAFGVVADAASQAVVDAINNVPVDSSTDKPLSDVKVTAFTITQP
jgi:cyclophilin family peptidyl-prolyl cis-trans isomerase